MALHVNRQSPETSQCDDHHKRVIVSPLTLMPMCNPSISRVNSGISIPAVCFPVTGKLDDGELDKQKCTQKIGILPGPTKN